MAEEEKKFNTLFGARVSWPCDMSDDLLEFCVQNAKEHQHLVESNGAEVCENLKKALDVHPTHGGDWHVTCGKNFGTATVHNTGYFAFFYLEDRAFMMFKA